MFFSQKTFFSGFSLRFFRFPGRILHLFTNLLFIYILIHIPTLLDHAEGDNDGENFSAEKFSPCPFQKTLEQGVGIRLTRGFTVAEVQCRGRCARRLEIPTCGRPGGFDSGLRPPLRMTRKGGFLPFHCGDNHYAMIAPALFIDI